MRPLGIVICDPRGQLFAGMIEPEEQTLVQQFGIMEEVHH